MVIHHFQSILRVNHQYQITLRADRRHMSLIDVCRSLVGYLFVALPTNMRLFLSSLSFQLTRNQSDRSSTRAELTEDIPFSVLATLVCATEFICNGCLSGTGQRPEHLESPVIALPFEDLLGPTLPQGPMHVLQTIPLLCPAPAKRRRSARPKHRYSQALFRHFLGCAILFGLICLSLNDSFVLFAERQVPDN